MNPRKMDQLKVDLKTIIDFENEPLPSLDVTSPKVIRSRWWNGDKSERLKYLQIKHPNELESHGLMLIALQHLQSDLSKSEIDLNFDKYVRAIRSIIDAASQQLNCFWVGIVDHDENFNEEMLFLTETINLLHHIVNKEELNSADFIELTKKYFILEKDEKIQDELMLKPKSAIYAKLSILLLVAGILLTIAFTVAAFMLLGTAIAPILAVGGFIVGLGILGGSSLGVMHKCNQLLMQAMPAHNLVNTLFAAKCTARACEIPLALQKKSYNIL